MKVNREMVIRAALELLNEVGLEQLTLRGLAQRLDIQAATLYWHFKSKQDLLDEMATLVLAEGAKQLVPPRESAEWSVWATSFGVGLRKVLLGYRDGAKMVAGTRLTDTEYMRVPERVAGKLVASGFSVRQAAMLVSTIYDYTLGLVLEEQVVFPVPDNRSPQYDVDERNAALDPTVFPLLRKAGTMLFDNFERRYKDGLALIVRGASVVKEDA